MSTPQSHEAYVEELGRLSPFELKDELIKRAEQSVAKEATSHKFLNAGRGNPNWISTTPREAFFSLGQFALIESERVWKEPDLGGMPHITGIAERFEDFLNALGYTRATDLLRRAVHYGVTELGFQADAFVHELCDAVIGDNYPEPDRMLEHAEAVVHRFLVKVMCDDKPPEGRFQLFAVEGGTAAMCYVFESLLRNGILRRGDTVALGTPIFTPYIELPHLENFELQTINVAQTSMEGARHTWQYSEDELKKLENPKVKAFFIVNPSNPASFAMAAETRQALVELVTKKRPDLLILTDDVYGTFVEGFRSLAADLPHNTILVYSYSKHFGCTGWRLGVIAMHEHHVVDEKLRDLPERERDRLHRRYESLALDPETVKFIDRLVADSRDVALNHTAGLSTPQQAQMTLFSLFSLLDQDDEYTHRCRKIVHERFKRLFKGLGIDIPDDPLRVAYYADLDLEAWGRHFIGDDFVAYVEAHRDPTDVVMTLAQRYGTVLLNGKGFDGPPWSIRVSLANLDADAYEAIGRDIRDLLMRAVSQWRETLRR
ncbi:MAG: bifunctional aspartate transaminase/aspartate 4-decarboxylase [Kofleriaceae bacterium]|nr:bifunctional aspartate transaminase/aspartate 4-decarboxylase [Kofleriaceae bacterium]